MIGLSEKLEKGKAGLSKHDFKKRPEIHSLIIFKSKIITFNPIFTLISNIQGLESKYENAIKRNWVKWKLLN